MSFEETVDPQQREQKFVHEVYNEIASHFSQTRYKPWPIVEDFLKTRATGTIGIDVGCGNGKYLGINPNVFIIGSDRSDGLIGCAREFGHEVMVADGLALPHPDNTFDFAISIAVIHHFSTEERRTEAIKHILSKVKPGGEALIYVWALEQESSRRGYKEGMDQDILVPWVLQKKVEKKKVEGVKRDLSGMTQEQRMAIIQQDKLDRERELQERKRKEEEEKKALTKFRYYHMYTEGELERNAIDAGGEIVRNGYEKDNWWAVIRRV